MPNPYIGVTGFETIDQVDRVARMLSGKSYLLMNGILVSHKTLNGQENNWPMRYPKREQVAGMLSGHPSVLNIVHYNTSDLSTLSAQLLGVIGLCAASGNTFLDLHGFQLNIRWPDPEALKKFKNLTRERYQIILQIGRSALAVADTPEALWRSPQEVANLLNRYEGIVDYILLDPSGGLGRTLEVDTIDRYLEAIYKEAFTFGIGIAGGFSAETAKSIASLALKYPGLCVDAEGKLRDESDQFNMDKAAAYVKEIAEVLTDAQQALRA